MRVARLVEQGRIDLVEERNPVPRAGESLVEVRGVGLCGSDLHWYADGGIGDARLARPLVLGHEVAGLIVEGPRAGEHVVIDPAVPCGTCETCLHGHRNLCPTVDFAGHGTTDGGLRQLMSWPDAQLHTLPLDFDIQQASLLEPLGVALHAIDLAHIRLADRLTIIGGGPIGLLLVQLARAAGAATVLVVEPLPHRQVAALRYGADAVIAPADAVEEGMFATALGPPGADVVLEVVGSEPAVALSVRAARPGGRVVLVGIPDEDRTAFPASVARRKGLTLAVVRRMKDMYPRAVELVDRGVVDLSGLITHRYDLEHVSAAFDTASRREGLKVLVEPHRRL